MAALWAVSVATWAGALELDCTNGADDDADGPADCADDDCYRDGACMFSVTRNFELVRDPITMRPWLNVYFVSWPELTGLQDIANSYPSPASNNKCVNDLGPPAGPAVPDGFLNADDILCTLWTSRDGVMSVNHFNEDTCRTEIRTAERGPFGIVFRSSWDGYIDTNGDGVKDTPDPNQALDTDRTSNPSALDDYRFIGYQVSVGHATNPTAVPANTAVLEGWCDDTWTGQVIANGCEPAFHFLHFPFGSLYLTADDILCGREGFDWFDADGDGDPDDCPNGIFDGDTQVSVESLDNDPTSTPESDNLSIARTVLRLEGNLVFLGRDFDLAAGEAYVVETSPAHRPTLWRPPTDGMKCR